MSLAIDPRANGRAQQNESALLEKFGLRWAVLAAWRDDLARRGVALGQPLARRLEGSRTKIASGCFSTCDVGCDLAAVERDLGAAEGSTSSESMAFWIELLGRAMADGDDVERLLRIPAVRARFVDCGARSCRCDN